MSPTTADFSQILELQQFRKLYEEQEEKVKLRLGEKDEEIEQLRDDVVRSQEQVTTLNNRLQEAAQEVERMRADYERLRQEAQEKIDKLMERIKELNQRLMAGSR